MSTVRSNFEKWLLPAKPLMFPTLMLSAPSSLCWQSNNFLSAPSCTASKYSIFNPFPPIINPLKLNTSNIRIHLSVRSSVWTPSRAGYPPWIQKRGGLESSGWIASSLYWKTKTIAFFVAIFASSKLIFFCWTTVNFGYFQDFSRSAGARSRSA